MPTDRSTVIDLPPLEDLLEEARTPTGTLNMPTPPRGWKPGISVARPQTRPQLIAAIALAAVIVGGLIYLGVRMLATPPVLDESEIEPPELPRVERTAPAEPQLPPFTAPRSSSGWTARCPRARGRWTGSATRRASC